MHDQTTTPTPNILLLSCGTGEGHNSAARAIAEALEQRGAACTMADPLALHGRRTGAWVAGAYTRMIQKAPGAFNLLYKAGDLVSSERRSSPVYYANSLGARDLAAYVEQNRFTAVVCTHLFAMETMTAARREGLCRLPCYGVLTDYTCIPFTEETRLDGYFIPHRDLIGELTGKGMARERLFATGIPVRRRFRRPITRQQAREALGIPQQQTVFLVMGGSAGCGHIPTLCSELEKQPGDWNAFVFVGRNRELQQTLEQQAGTGRVRAVPYTGQVDLYMRAADALITKPGGLTSTEAAVANVPLVHLLAYSACEEKNVEFFSARGMSVRAADGCQAAAEAWRLARDPQAAQAMRRAQQAGVNPDAAEEIAERVLKAE